MKVTPISVMYTIVFSIATLSLTLPAVAYYTNPALASVLNGTYLALQRNFTTVLFAPTYAYTFNSSSGLKASNSLQQFTGLAFMFGALYQVAFSSYQGIPMISTLLGTIAQYGLLPGVNIIGLIILYLAMAGLTLMWWFISNWTKVEP